MYREIQELKKKGLSSMDIDKYYAAINYRKTAEQYLAEFKKTKNTDYKYAAEGQLRKAEELEREYKKHLHNADEEKDNDIGQFVKGLRKKELEKSGFDKKTVDYLTKKNEEEGYYAKLAEEKKNGDMDKGGKIYWDCINAHKKLGRAYGNLFNAVGGVEEIINYGVDPETNFSPDLARKLESWTRIIENCERQLRTIR